MTSRVRYVYFYDERKRYVHILITKSIVAFRELLVAFITGAIEARSEQAALNETVEMAALLCLNILQKSKCPSKPK